MSLAPAMPGPGTSRTDPALRAAAAASVASADSAGRQTAFPACDLCASGAGAVGNALTLTLPKVAGQRHYVGLVQISKFTAVPLALALTTPPLIATTNLATTPSVPVSGDVLAVGAQQVYELRPLTPIVSAVANVDTTLVCPAVAGVIWRASAWYFAAP